MHIGVFPAGAMPHVYAELEHIEAIRHNIFAKFRVQLLILFGFGWQVKEYKYPHDAIGV
jgi:hypothetical protein